MHPFLKTLKQSLKDIFLQAYNFKGTTGRKTFWYVTIFLFVVLGLLLLYPVFFYFSTQMFHNLRLFILFGILTTNEMLLTIFMYALLILSYVFLIPYLALLSRRLNDAGFSGFYISLLLLFFIPFSLFKIIILVVVLGLFIFVTLLPSIQ
jgi:uncharacterized membrane protein YhaH (DUF805 family)